MTLPLVLAAVLLIYALWMLWPCVRGVDGERPPLLMSAAGGLVYLQPAAYFAALAAGGGDFSGPWYELLLWVPAAGVVALTVLLNITTPALPEFIARRCRSPLYDGIFAGAIITWLAIVAIGALAWGADSAAGHARACVLLGSGLAGCVLMYRYTKVAVARHPAAGQSAAPESCAGRVERPRGPLATGDAPRGPFGER